MKHDAAEILQRINKEEIFYSIKRNKDKNSPYKFVGCVETMESTSSYYSFDAKTKLEAIQRLAEVICEKYSKSKFAKWWRESNG